jgi:hypothetical protein
VTTGEGMRPGCMMKILEAERWLKGTNFHEVAFLRRQVGRWKGTMHEGSAKDMVALQGGRPPFKGDSPHLRPQPLRVESSPTRSKILPPRRGGWVPHVMQAGPGEKKPTHHARGA